MILFWVLVVAFAAVSMWQIAYQVGWSKGWRDGCGVYRPFLDDAWQRSNQYRNALMTLRPASRSDVTDALKAQKEI